MTNILLLDIDHTISDAAWRDEMMASGDWEAYHLAGREDKPVAEISELIKTLSTSDYETWQIICVTARPEKWRTQTMQWFIRHRIPVDEILMRPDLAFRSAFIIKTELLKTRFGENLEELHGCHVLAIDDNEKAIEAFRGLGITTLHIAVAKRRT